MNKEIDQTPSRRCSCKAPEPSPPPRSHTTTTNHQQDALRCRCEGRAPEGAAELAEGVERVANGVPERAGVRPPKGPPRPRVVVAGCRASPCRAGRPPARILPVRAQRSMSMPASCCVHTLDDGDSNQVALPAGCVCYERMHQRELHVPPICGLVCAHAKRKRLLTQQAAPTLLTHDSQLVCPPPRASHATALQVAPPAEACARGGGGSGAHGVHDGHGAVGHGVELVQAARLEAGWA